MTEMEFQAMVMLITTIAKAEASAAVHQPISSRTVQYAIEDARAVFKPDHLMEG